jgi:hypothetical protein
MIQYLISMTSVDLMRAAAVSPTFKRISRTASDVTIDVMFCHPIDRRTCAKRPSTRISVTRPIS